MSNAPNTSNKVTDESGDHKYFTITPRLVWAFSRTPYDLSLWETVKSIAGDKGECFISTPDLAILAMMSTGKVLDCRAYWIELGLLQGEIRRDPGYPQPVWHLHVPDLWKVNVEWAENHLAIASRVNFKRKLKSIHPMKPSLHEEGILSGEWGITPHEEGTPPGETKKRLKEDLKEKEKEKSLGFQENPALTAGLLDYFISSTNMASGTHAKYIAPLQVFSNGTAPHRIIASSAGYANWIEGRLEKELTDFFGEEEFVVTFEGDLRQ